MPQNSFKIWETTETKHPTKYQRCLVMCWNALFFNLLGGSKVTVNQCRAHIVMVPELNNQFGVYEKLIFCKVTVPSLYHCEIGDVLLGEFCRSHGICDTCFRHQKEDVDKLLLLCRVDCKSPESHGEYNPTMDSKGCVMWG